MPNLRQWLVTVVGTGGFYLQAILGQAEILHKPRPTAVVLRDPHGPDDVKRKLELVQEVRCFSHKHLGLPADRQYDRDTDLGRRYVSRTVYAAPEFSVEGKTWWYPLVGAQNDRGFLT